MAEIVDAESGRVIVAHARFARMPWTRAIGLIARSTLGSDEALIFENNHAVHTWFMGMPIDVVFTDAAWTIVAVFAETRPWRVITAPAACHTIELAAGSASTHALTPGTNLQIRSAL